jgi:tRNA A37 methylthiotransferase MiaB
MHDIRIFFSCPSVTYGATYRGEHNQEKKMYGVYLSTVPCYLDSYIKVKNPELYKKLFWSKISVTTWNQQQIVDYVVDNKCNVLCFSVYNWNRNTIKEVTCDLKNKIPHEVIVIVGGPSIEAHGLYDWQKDYPDADYAVFSDGEKAFHDILCHHFDNQSLNILNTNNLLWRKNNKIQKAPAAYVKNTVWSPYLESSHLLRQMADDPEYHDCELEISYETSRGCPYSCSFCDWTSGLGPLTVKRKVDYQAEIDLFVTLGISQLHISDANFGQWPVDLEIANYMAKVLPPNHIKTQPPNLSKNKKDRAYKIQEIWLESGVCVSGKFSVQDIDPVILSNIDRPDIPWEEHKKYIRHINSLFPDRGHYLECMKGLPGQTRQTWKHLLREAYQLNLVLEAYTWILIPNSPAMHDPEYMKKFNIKTRKVKYLGHDIISSSYSFNELDIAFMTFTQITYRMLRWFGVSLEEFDEFNNNIQVQWEKKHYLTILTSMYSMGTVLPDTVTKILQEVFANHKLSEKYHQQYAEFANDTTIIHKQNSLGGVA